MLKHYLSPHLNRLPLPESVEELKSFYFVVAALFRHPLVKLNELHWLAIDVVAQTLLAHRIVLVGETGFNVFVGVVIHNF